jgi:hypothetical protein
MKFIKLERAPAKIRKPTKPALAFGSQRSCHFYAGMMDTFLNVGINREICEGLSRQKHFEWACLGLHTAAFSKLGA